MKGFFGVVFISLLAAGMGHAEIAGEWKALAHMPHPRQELATAVLNGKIYVIAGLAENFIGTNNVDVYNPATNTWTSVAPIPILNHHNCAAVAAGKLFAFGGQSRFNFLYDPVDDSWSQVAPMPVSQPLTAAVGVIDDKIYVAGVGILQVYDPATDAWSTRAPMGVYRHHTAGGLIDGKFYVVGGRDGPGSQTALEVYDPQTNSWTRLANMPTGREGHAAGVVNGELFVFGGEGGGIHPEVEVYNPASNSWRRVEPDMPFPRHGIWASVIGNKIYIAGGGLEENISQTSWTHV
ncbi:MAG TPA: kelch repeat-containing protein, partial [Chthoniobacterales bacterium]|nr:kelch repeat-containing protein [Chthoniobacterales bacterium]